MNDISHSSELLDQLKSLSIERVEPAGSSLAAAPTQARARSRRRSFPTKTVLLLGVLAGAGAGIRYTEIPPQELMARASKALVAALPAAYQPQSLGAEAGSETGVTVGTEKAPSIAPTPVPVAIAVPAVVGSGYVVADRELALMPDIGGRIARLDIDTGDRFVEGQVIAILDSDTALTDLRIAEAGLTMARAAMARSEASLDEARATLARQEQLLAKGSVPRTAVETARFAVIRQQGDVRVNAQQIEIAGLEVEKHREHIARHQVVAPFSGVVVKRHLNVGDMALSVQDSGPGMGIATLIDPEALTIEVDVSETNLAKLAPGQTARVRLDAYPNRDFAAVVKTIAPKVSIQKGTVQVRLAFETLPPGVFANMAAKVTFDAPEQTASLHQKGN